MSDYETETVFTRFGENIREAISCEVLKFIDIETKWFTLLWLDRCTTHDIELEFADEEGSEHLTHIFPYFSF